LKKEKQVYTNFWNIKEETRELFPANFFEGICTQKPKPCKNFTKKENFRPTSS
jgi:hypothetical protein